MYEAFCADGSCLPPVIFLPEPPQSGSRYQTAAGHDAILLHIPGLGGPSTESTRQWLKAVTRTDEHYFEDSPHIIFDALRGHFAEAVEEEWENNIDATTHKLPATLGRWLNPCDQAINREMRRHFVSLQMRNRAAKLDNIISAYYSISDETVKNSFNKCGIFGGDPEEVIERAAHDGYRTTGKQSETLRACEAVLLRTFCHDQALRLPPIVRWMGSTGQASDRPGG